MSQNDYVDDMIVSEVLEKSSNKHSYARRNNFADICDDHVCQYMQIIVTYVLKLSTKAVSMRFENGP